MSNQQVRSIAFAVFLVLLGGGFLAGVRASSEDHKHEGQENESHKDEEVSASVGPDKGVTSASEENGFQLAPEAIESFALKRQSVAAQGGIALPRAALVYSGYSVGVFRLRQGFYKRVAVKVIKQTTAQVHVQSQDLTDGDEVVVQGAPFLRIAEIDVTGGNEHGHSH